jgi:hypothetical protein
MPRKAPPPPASAPAPISRDDWALAFTRRVDELRPGMGSKYLAAVVATLWPKHRADDPERVAAQWVAEREGR